MIVYILVFLIKWPVSNNIHRKKINSCWFDLHRVLISLLRIIPLNYTDKPEENVSVCCVVDHGALLHLNFVTLATPSHPLKVDSQNVKPWTALLPHQCLNESLTTDLCSHPFC